MTSMMLPRVLQRPLSNRFNALVRRRHHHKQQRGRRDAPKPYQNHQKNGRATFYTFTKQMRIQCKKGRFCRRYHSTGRYRHYRQTFYESSTANATQKHERSSTTIGNLQTFRHLRTHLHTAK